MAATRQEAEDSDDGEDDTVTYQFEMSREEWREWTDSFPRDTPIPDRLETIILADTAALNRDTDYGRALATVLADDVSVGVNRQSWTAWKNTVPRNTDISDRLETALLADADALERGVGHPQALTNLQVNDATVEIGENVWEEWKGTIPRNESLTARLQTLIVQDTNSADVPDDEVAQYDTRTAATRIRVKSAGALSAVRDRDDPEEAIEKLSTIHDIADALESS